MEDYIKTLLEQVRFQKAHSAIEEEIRSHIEDQIEENILEGMDRETAVRKAVEDMGSPVDAGISFDSIHRPQIAWGVVIAALVVGLVGALFFLLGLNDSLILNPDNKVFYHGIDAKPGSLALVGFAAGDILFGVIAMLICYFIDYTTVAKYSNVVGAALLVLVLFASGRSTSYGAMLMIPLYAGIVYKCKGQGTAGFIKAFLWIVVPCGIASYKGERLFAAIVAVCMLVQLTIAIKKGWIKVPKIPAIASMWTVFAVVLAICVDHFYDFEKFGHNQMNVVTSGPEGSYEMPYTYSSVFDYLDSLKLFGRSKYYQPELSWGSYGIFNISDAWGIAIGFVVLAMVCALLVYGFVVSAKTKNQLGMVMGSGCMMLLAVNAIVDLVVKFGQIPGVYTFFPFMSGAGDTTIISYIFLGIILSIYKYKNAYSQHVDIGMKLKGLEL